jgi:hypothetical protein
MSDVGDGREEMTMLRYSRAFLSQEMEVALHG